MESDVGRMKKIAILGSTGSIGTQTLEVVRENGDIEVTAAAAGNNIALLEEQIREFHIPLAAVWSEEKAAELKSRVKDLDVRIVSGMDGLLEVAAAQESEILVTAIVGMIGIRPTIEAIKAGKDIALANKETLVTAGHLIMPLAKEYGVSILPVERAQRDLSVIAGRTEGGASQDPSDSIRRTVPRKETGRADKDPSGRCIEASELGDGTQDHDRLLDYDQQRTGSDRSEMAVRCERGSGTGCRAAAEYHSFHGGI